MKSIFFTLGTLLLFFILSCNLKQNSQTKWLKGSTEERFSEIESQFRGFGVAMIEIGHRYSELYWAGKDENWEYAEHQIEEIKEALDLALIRRPERKKSAEAFYVTLEAVEKAVVLEKTTSAFNAAFQGLTQSCNICHAAEDHSYIRIAPPEVRHSPVRFFK